LEEVLHKSRNILNQHELVSLIKTSLKPLGSQLKKLATEEKIIQNQNLGPSSFAAEQIATSQVVRLIRKIFFIVSEARLNYAKRCYSQLLDNILSSLNLYRSRDKVPLLSHTQKVFKGFPIKK